MSVRRLNKRKCLYRCLVVVVFVVDSNRSERKIEYLHAVAFHITRPTGPVSVPLGVITKFIMANMEPIRANKMATATLTTVTSQSLKLISSCWLLLSLAKCVWLRT